MNKRFLALLSAVAMLFTMMPMQAFALVGVNECGTNFLGKESHAYIVINGDATQHWLNCVCGAKEMGRTEHVWDAKTGKCKLSIGSIGCTYECEHTSVSKADCENDGTCNTCGFVVEEAFGHAWNDATCTEPKTCGTCGDTEGEALGHIGGEATCEVQAVCTKCGASYGKLADHSWGEATCDSPAVCSVCGEDNGGEALGHKWNNATCTEPKTCERCGETEGEALGCDMKDATCTEPKTCGRCGATEGEALGHEDIQKFDDEYHWDGCSKCDKKENAKKHTIVAKRCTGCEYINCLHETTSYLNADDVDALLEEVRGIWFIGEWLAGEIEKAVADISYEEYHVVYCADCYDVKVKVHDFTPATFTTAKNCNCGYSVGTALTVEVNGETVTGDLLIELGKDELSTSVEIKVTDGNGGYLTDFDVVVTPDASLEVLEAGSYDVAVTANGDTYTFHVLVEAYTPPTPEEIMEALKDKLQEKYEEIKSLIEEKVAETDLPALIALIKKIDKEDVEKLCNLLQKLDKEDIANILELAKDGIGFEDLVKIAEILPDLSKEEITDLMELINKFGKDSVDLILSILSKIDTSELEELLKELEKIDTSKLEEILEALKDLDEQDIKDALEALKDKTKTEVEAFLAQLKDKNEEQIKELIQKLKEKAEELEEELSAAEKLLKEELEKLLKKAFEEHTHIYAYESEEGCKCIVPKCTAVNNPHNYEEVTFNYSIDLDDLTADYEMELVIGENINITLDDVTSAQELKEKLVALEEKIAEKIGQENVDKAYAILEKAGIGMAAFKALLEEYTDVDFAALESKIKEDLLALKEKVENAEYSDALDLNDLYCKVEVCTSCGHVAVTEHIEGDWTSDSETEHVKTCTNDGCDKEFAREEHKLSDLVSVGAEGHNQTCADCKYETEIVEHNLGDYIETETTHHKECADCDYATEAETHTWVDGVCGVCGYVCGHEGENGETCTNCGKDLTETPEVEPTAYAVTEVKVNNTAATKSLDGETFSYGTLARGTKSAMVTFTLNQELGNNSVKVKVGDNDAVAFDAQTLTVEVTNLSNGANTRTVTLLVNDKEVATYTLNIRVRTSSGGGGGSSSGSSRPAAQDLLIVTTEVGSAAQLAANDKGIISISEKYTDEILEKAEGGVNFTGSAVAAPSVTSIKFTAKLLKELSERKDSNITEIGVDTKDASMRVKLSEILDKGDITITVKEATSLTSSQKKLADGAKLYTVEIKSSKIGVMKNFNRNVEVTLPYELGEDENPDTITIYSVDEKGKPENLRGTYQDGTAYCLVKELDHPMMVVANPVEFIDYIAPAWAESYVNQMASKNILLGGAEGSYLPATLSKKEFGELLRSLLRNDAEVSSEDNVITREESAEVISNMMEGNQEYKITMLKNMSFEDMGKISEQYSAAVNFAIRAGIMVGYEDDTIRPATELTRTEAAVIFTKIFKIINVF